MRVTALYFAMMREKTGLDREEFELSEGATVREAFLKLNEIRNLGGAGSLEILRFAVNRTFSPLDAILSDGDELAIVPPISGG